MTKRLYETNGYTAQFDAVVLDCQKQGERYAVELDETAFFPEGGGQLADTGILGGAAVLDVQLSSGRLLHFTDAALNSGEQVHGVIDWQKRLRSMQNHTGEHIVSGTAHTLYGCNNIGFHMGSEDITVDFDRELTADEIRQIEYTANERVAENREVRILFPDSDALAALDYRSKKKIEGAVRIVEIDGVDRCACCAPHLSRTGAVGGIKLLDFMRSKGGVRIHMLCGLDAIDDYNRKYENVYRISGALSAKQSDVADAVDKIKNELCNCRYELSQLRRRLVSVTAQNVAPSAGNITLFVEDFGAGELRELANSVSGKCAVCAVFSGSDDQGYNYMICSHFAKLRAYAKQINEAICGRGGGSDELLSGRCEARREDIERYFGSTVFDISEPLNKSR